MKAIVILKNGAVQEVLADHPDLQIIIVNRDVEGLDPSNILPDVGGEPAALDTLRQGRAQVQPARVAALTDEVIRRVLASIEAGHAASRSGA